MNYGISVLFRAIPLLMALFCFGYGWFITSYGTDPNRYVAGPVIFSLGMICIALFSTAATIIRQIIGTFGNWLPFSGPDYHWRHAYSAFFTGLSFVRCGTCDLRRRVYHCLCRNDCHFFHPFHHDYRKCPKERP